MPRVFKETNNVAVVLSLGVYASIISFIAGVALVVLDKTAMEHDAQIIKNVQILNEEMQ